MTKMERFRDEIGDLKIREKAEKTQAEVDDLDKEYKVKEEELKELAVELRNYAESARAKQGKDEK